jgi:hypothetical protein
MGTIPSGHVAGTVAGLFVGDAPSVAETAPAGALARGAGVTAALADGGKPAPGGGSLRQPASALSPASTPSATEIACAPGERCERREGTSEEPGTEAPRMAKAPLARHP